MTLRLPRTYAVLATSLSPLLAATAAYASPGAAIGEPREIPTTTGSAVGNLRIASNGKGNTALTWVEAAPPYDSNYKLCAQALNADGSPSAAAVCQTDPLYYYARNFNLALNKNGELAITFVSIDKSYMVRLDQSLQSMGAPVELFQYTKSTFFNYAEADTPGIAADEDGDFIVSWLDAVFTLIPPIPYLGLPYGYSNLHTLTVGADGMLGSASQLEFNPGYPGLLGSSLGYGTELLGRPGGGYMMAYTDGGLGGEEVKLRQITSNGYGYVMPGAVATARRMYHPPKLANTPDGGAVVVYSPQDPDTLSGEIYMRRYSASRAKSAAVKLNQQTKAADFTGHETDLAVSADGAVAVGWSGYVAGNVYSPYSIRLAIQDADNKPLLGETMLPVPANTNNQLGGMVSGSSDDFFIAWIESPDSDWTSSRIVLGRYSFH